MPEAPTLLRADPVNLPPPSPPAPDSAPPHALLPSAPSAARFSPPQTRCGSGCADTFLADREAAREQRSHRDAHGERTGLIPTSRRDVLVIPAAFPRFRVARKGESKQSAPEADGSFSDRKVLLSCRSSLNIHFIHFGSAGINSLYLQNIRLRVKV